jgi:hypothetical protein
VLIIYFDIAGILNGQRAPGFRMTVGSDYLETTARAITGSVDDL